MDLQGQDVEAGHDWGSRRETSGTKMVDVGEVRITPTESVLEDLMRLSQSKKLQVRFVLNILSVIPQ